MENRFKLKGTPIRIYDDGAESQTTRSIKNHKDVEVACVINGKIKARTIYGNKFTAELFMDIDKVCNDMRQTSRTDNHYDRGDLFTFSRPLRPPYNRSSVTKQMETADPWPIATETSTQTTLDESATEQGVYDNSL